MVEDNSFSALFERLRQTVEEFHYPPATVQQLDQTEQALGFALPPLLHALYGQVANGGFGPGEGIIGAIGGASVDGEANIATAYHALLGTYEDTWIGDDDEEIVETLTWPERLLRFCHWGCADWSCLDANTGQVFRVPLQDWDSGMPDSVWYLEATSLEAWLSEWCAGHLHFFAHVPRRDELRKRLAREDHLDAAALSQLFGDD